jgi:hypothetical protein
MTDCFDEKLTVLGMRERKEVEQSPAWGLILVLTGDLQRTILITTLGTNETPLNIWRKEIIMAYSKNRMLHTWCIQ